jgi:enoyl-CoA hydratase
MTRFDACMSTRPCASPLTLLCAPLLVYVLQVHLNYARDHTMADSLHHQAVWNASMLRSSDIGISVRARMKGQPPVYPDV